jgi:PAS domain S-box-containing protein
VRSEPRRSGRAAAPKQTAEALREAEAAHLFFSGVFKHMTEGVYLIRVADGVIMLTNAKFDEMFGYGPDELVGKNVSVVNAPTEKKPEDVAQEIMAELNRSGRWTGEVLNIRKDGTTFWSEAVVSTMDHPSYGAAWLSVHRDITERKRAEHEKERPTCLGDPMPVDQVFANLIENALKYRSPDRATVIRITGRREDGMAAYCVEDNGIGIEPEQQERVFTPFFRDRSVL